MIHVMLAMLAAAHHVPKVAVLDMVDESGEQAALARQLTEVLVSEVAAHSDVLVVSTVQIKQILSYEKQKELLGCKDDSCVTELAGALGVDYLIMAQLGKIGSRFRVDLRIADAQHANLVASAGDFVSNNVDDVADAVVHLTEKVLLQAHLEKSQMRANLALAPGATPAAGPAGQVTTAAPGTAGPERTPAYVAWGIAGGLAVAATVMTIVTATTFNSASNRSNSAYLRDADSLSWKGPLADGLWAGTLVAAGVGAYFFFSAAPAGAGGEVAVGGRF